MHRNTAIAFSAAIVALTAVGCAFRLPYLAPEYRDPIVAIDVALEADRTPPDPATAVKPHITLLQGYIKSTNVHAFTANVAMVMATTHLDRLTVKTIGGSGQAGAVDASQELRRLQERLTEIFSLYAVDPTDDTSVIVTSDGLRPSADAMHNVLSFVPAASRVNYRPHIVAGAGQAPSTAGFKPMGAAVYQLDRTGLAMQTLWTWTGESGVR